MNDLLELIYIPGNLLETVCRIFILGFSFDMILNFASLIGASKDSVS